MSCKFELDYSEVKIWYSQVLGFVSTDRDTKRQTDKQVFQLHDTKPTVKDMTFIKKNSWQLFEALLAFWHKSIKWERNSG